MTDFVSEENYIKHREAAGRDVLRLSVYEKSLPISGKSACEIARMRVRGFDMREVAELWCDVLLHRVFFGSFCDRTHPTSRAVREQFGSEAVLLDELFRCGMRLRRGFVAVVRERGRISAVGSESSLEVVLHGEVLLAVDVSEHAYYGDYPFDKESYLKAALSHLDLSVTDEGK